MIRRIWSALIASITPQSPAPSALEQARKAYDEAKAAYVWARARGDTRAIGAAWRDLQQAKTRALALELCR